MVATFLHTGCVTEWYAKLGVLEPARGETILVPIDCSTMIDSVVFICYRAVLIRSYGSICYYLFLEAAQKFEVRAGLIMLLFLLSALPVAFGLQPPLLNLHSTLFGMVNSACPLQKSDFTSVMECETHSRGSCAWFSEVSPRYLTGVSFYTLDDSVSIDIWSGPSYDFPHCLLRISENEDDATFSVESDYVPRGPTPIGSDPQMIDKFYSHSVPQSVGSFLATPPSFSARILQSPMRMGLTSLSFAQAEELAKGHIERWLGWVNTSEQIPARSRGAFNARDDKLRQFAFQSWIEKGEDRAIAAGNTGPIAEAYVGGGS